MERERNPPGGHDDSGTSKGPKDLKGVVRAIVVRSFPEFLASAGVASPARLIRASGIEPEELNDPEALLSMRACAEMFERAAHETGRGTLGLDFGLQLPWRDLGVLGHVIFSATSLGEGLDDVRRFYAATRILGEFSREAADGEVRVSFSPQDTSPVQMSQMSFALFAFLMRYCREATGRADLSPREVRFRCAAPPEPAPLEAFFGAPVRFSASKDAFIFAAHDLEHPLAPEKPDPLPHLRRHAQQLLATLPPVGDYLLKVRRCTTKALADGHCDIDEIARRLKTSARSLQRHLQEAGSSYQKVLGGTRLAMAQLYLKDRSLSLPEIAYLLGYADQSVLSRAFRRWSGKKPLAYRKG